MEHNKSFMPLYETIPNHDTNQLIDLFSSKKDLMVLNSEMITPEHGQFSFICFDAFACFYSKGTQYYWNKTPIDIINPFDFINERIQDYRTEKIEHLPALQGGVVGYFGYEANHYLEKLPSVIDNIQLPDIYLNFYSTIIAIDNVSNQSWIIATGFPETDETKRIQHAQQSILDIKTILSKSASHRPVCNAFKKNNDQIISNFTETSYIQAVNTTKQYILNGDIFEANISQQFSTTLPNNTNALDLYHHLMKTNPAPFSAFLTIASHGFIISASPERFIRKTNQQIETCPIKGTRKRSNNRHEDKQLAEDLLSSEKDFAENVMIVDLMRNDLSKVCQKNSIQVDELCALKSFPTVHHLVSKITGKLKDDLHAIDVIKASFPPGSITGAPKIRAMEIISELEQRTRGPYCGILGYLGFTGDMDTCVIIRTYFINKDSLFFSAGGAIVLDSTPKEEYEESLTKAHALMRTLTQ